MASGPRTLAVDIGGTGLKTIVLDGKGKPHGGEDAIGEVIGAARAESFEQRRAEHARGHALVDRGLERPAALARVRHPAREVAEFLAFEQCLRRQVEEPRGDDAPASPDLGDVGDVQVVLVELGTA